MRQSYSRLQIALHWLIAVLIVVQFLSDDPVGEAFRQMMRGAEVTSGPAVALHVYGGIAILALVVLRLVVRLVQGAPQPPEAESERLKRVAHLTHWALYAVMVLIPVTGLAAWFGGIGASGEVHEVLGNLLLFLVGLHVLGVLYHQFILGTNLIARMRP